MAKHMYDIVATTGSYVNRDGEEKRNYQKVGAVFKGDKGPFIVFKAWFNPAAVQREEGSDSIFLSLFEPKDDEDKGSRNSKPQRRSRDDDDEPRKAKPKSKGDGDDPFDDDEIPF